MLGLEKFSRVNLLSGAATAALLLGSAGVAHATSATTDVITVGTTGYTTSGYTTQAITQNVFNLPTPSSQSWNVSGTAAGASVSATTTASGNQWQLSVSNTGSSPASGYYQISYTNLTPEQVLALSSDFTNNVSNGPVTVSTSTSNTLTVRIPVGATVTLPFNPNVGSSVALPGTTPYTYDTTGAPAPVTGALTPLTIQSGITGASVTNGNTTAPGTTTGNASSQSVASNLISASAVGNTSTVNPTTSSAFSLTSLGSNGSANGTSVLVGQTVVGSGEPGGNVDVTAAVTNSTQSVTSSDLLAGSQTNIGSNTISASVTLNNSSTTLSGSIPVNYTNAGVLGSSILSASILPVSGSVYAPGGVHVSASGNIVATNDQLTAFTGVTSPASSVTGNNNTLSVTTAVPSGTTFDASGIQASQTANAIDATYTGNAANTVISVASGGAPTLAGSAVLTNVQETALNTTPTNAQATGNTVATDFTGNGNNSVLALNSTINTTGNTIGATATGNQATGTAGAAGNVITLAPGVSLSGVTLQQNASTIYSSQALSADLALNSLQMAPNGAPVSAQTTGNEVGQTSDQAAGSTLNLSSNAINATATTNNVSNAINAGTGGTGITTASISGLIGLQNSQVADAGSGATALAGNNGIVLDAGTGPVTYTVANNTITATGNSIGATATGNNATNTAGVAADTVALGGAGAAVMGVEAANLVTGEPTATSSAGLSVNNVQLSSISPVSASNSGNGIVVDALSSANNLSGNIISLQGGTTPALQALAESNVSNNSASVNATTLTGSVGVVNDQTQVLGGTTATLSDGVVGIAAGAPGHLVTGDTISVGSGLTGTVPTGTGGNTLRALSYNNQGTNAVSVTATTATLPGTNDTAVTVPFNIALAPTLSAAYGSLSSQDASGASQASASFGSIPVVLTVTDGAVADTLSNASNVIAAAAYSNQETNSASVTATTLGQTGTTPAPMVSAATAQGTDAASVTASITGPGTGSTFIGSTVTTPSALFASNVGPTAGSLNGYLLSASTDAVSGNTAIAQARVNSANTTTSVAGGNIVDPGLISGLSAFFPQTGTAGLGNADAAITAVTSQYSLAAPASATQSATGAYTAVNGGVDSSTLLAQSNTFSASATNNVGTTGVTVGSAAAPVTSVNATAGVLNAQYTDGLSTATATLGSAGRPATAPYSGGAFAVSSTGLSAGTWSGDQLAVTGASATLTFASAADAAAFVGNVTSGSYTYTPGTSTVTVGAGATLTFASAFGSTANWDYTIAGANSTQQGTFSLAGTPAVPTYPAVQVLIGGNLINNSTLVTSANLATASATGNSATNALAVNATTLDNGGVTTQAVGTSSGELDGATAVGTNTVLNQQIQEGAVNATGFGLFTVTDVQSNPTITGSTLTVSGNGVSVSGTGNKATSGLTVSANYVNGATATISSNQGQSASVYASSGSGTGTTVTNYGMTVQAPVAVNGSTVSMTGNTNTVTATGNSSGNTLNETGVNLLSANSAIQASTVGYVNAFNDGATQNASADLVITNAQTQNANVGSTATSLIANNDLAATTSGLVSSTASLSTNATKAASVGNTTANTLAINATSVDQTAALSTSQVARLGSTAYANQAVAFALPGGLTIGAPAASQSTINLQSNATDALAQGNVATNAVNVTADTANGAAIDAGVGAGQATATYALANLQQAYGAVASTGVTNVSVSDALAYPAITGSTINVTGNSVNATGQANLANSSMTIASNSANGSTGVTGAVSNYQTETSGSTADATGSFSAPVRLDTSSVSISSNTTGSLSSGNTATNALSVSTTDLTNVTPAAASAPNSASFGTNPSGTFVVANQQLGNGAAAATTTASILNSDSTAATTSGLVSSSAALDSNTATAASNVNLASNTLTLAALNSSATGALTSNQVGNSTSTANVTQTVGFNLAGGATVSTPAASDATIQANNNAASAVASVNSAANALNVSATAGASTVAPGQAGAGYVAPTPTLPQPATQNAGGTYALANWQQATTAATANGQNSVTVADNGLYPAITGSAISVNGNSLVAGSQLNTASNALTVAVADSQNATGGTGPYAVTAALANYQSGDGASTANAGTVDFVGTPPVLQVGLPGQILTATGRLDNSTMSISNNLTQAQAIGNNATNAMGVTGTNVGANTTLSATVGGATSQTQVQTASATYAVQNTQVVGGTVSAAAVTRATNSEFSVAPGSSSSGLNSSAVAINGNTTQALGFANNATNQLSLNATDLGATGAVGNAQTSTSDVNSVAIGLTGYSLNGTSAATSAGTNAAATGSTIAVSNNTVQSQAVGNAASNALNATATAAYGTALPASNTLNGGVQNSNQATASFAVLNSQSNAGAVSSYASGGGVSASQYFVALNTSSSGTPAYGASGAVNSTVGVTGNAVQAASYGNTATNSIALAALNSGNATAALTNNQVNSGNVTATASDTHIGILAVGTPGSVAGGVGLNGSTASVGGNSITARAVGNSAISSITAR